MTSSIPPLQPVPHDVLPCAQRDRLEAWLDRSGRRLREVLPMPGDVSTRRYFRLVLDSGSAVLAVYPPGQEEICSRFTVTSRLLESVGVRVPGILVTDCDGCWALVEDVGDQTLDEWGEGRAWDELAPWYRRVVAPARAIAGLAFDRVVGLCPPLDLALLESELDKTWETFLAPRGFAGDGGEERALRDALSDLCRAIAAAPPAPCHRDLTPRNLVPLGDGQLAFLDHQDLRLGPPLYDLASLLNDTLFPPPELEGELLAAWGVSADSRVDYHRVAAQRTLKAVGSYAGAALAGKPRRLALVPPTLARALTHLAASPETAHLTARLRERWRPALTGHD